MHIEHILGLYVFGSNERSGPTNMHNTAMAANSTRKIRFAQDLALYNLTLSEEIDGFDGAAHIEAWNSDPEWQGARKVTEALTAVQDDWGEAIFAANVVFEPLIGELFRSNLVMQAAAPNGDFVTPTVMGAGEYDYSQRDLRWTLACFGPLAQDREFADHNRQLMQGWLRTWVAQALEAARTVEEGVITDPREADVGSILGFGFAPFTGGALSYIDGIGAKDFVARCERLQASHGDRFRPNALLLDMAASGASFYSPARSREAA
jgi:hypothetical protein